MPRANSESYEELKEIAKRADFLRTSIRKAIWISTVVTAIVTTALIFTVVALTGGDDRALAKRVDEGIITIIAELRRDHREMKCIMQVEPNDRTAATFDRCFKRSEP